jgi:Na+/melibiose symporter-like transporter
MLLGKERAVASNTGSQSGEFRPLDYVKITLFGFVLSAFWSSLHLVILPLRLLDFVPEARKNTYLDLLILTGYILAMAVQPIAGALSDRSTFRWGRRRPYILLGGVLLLLFLPGIGLAGSYAVIFIIYCLLQISSNTAQGPFQGFIPDLVPVGRRGTASGVRSLFNIAGGVVLIRVIAPLMDRYFTGDGRLWLWLALGIPAIILLGGTLATVLTVKEQPKTTPTQSVLLSALRASFKIDARVQFHFILFLVACFLIFTAWGTLMAHALYYLMDVVNITRPAEITGNLLIVVGAAMLVVVYPVGRLCDRVGRYPVAVASGFLGALGIVAIFFSQSYWQVVLSAALLGVCSGAWMSTQWALATDLVGWGEEARYLGLVNMSIAGAGVVSRLVGPVIDYFNSVRHDLGYQVMLLVCFVFFIAGSLLLLRIKGRRLTEKV